MKLTDQELLKELESRFAQQSKMISEQKQFMDDLEKVNARLVESEKLKSDFLSNIKNEINNPITSMLGLLKLMMSQPEKGIDLTKLVFKETYILNFHLQNVFLAAELEAGEASPDYSTVSIHDLIKKVCESLEGIYHENHVKIDLNLKGPSEFVTDRSMLEITLSNLISNAIKFSHTNSSINIEYRQNEPGNIEISVQDFGVGISEEDSTKIYDRFKQLDTGTTKQYGGHGLGLSVVQSVVDLLDGNISMTCEIGKGSVFKVTLPEGTINSDNSLFEDEDEFLFSDTSDDTQIF
ncbi:MAG: HAMP domain-containing histidine kinase [Cyclobacteriaceae bacterium]